MAAPTKLYMTATVAPYAPPAPAITDYKGRWDAGYSNAVTLATVASGTVFESKRTTPTTADSDNLLRRGVLDPALTGGGLFGDTVKLNMLGRETNAAANAFLHVHICVLAGASATVRGTLLRDHVGSSEFAVSTSVRSLVSSPELVLETVQAEVGDLILAEVGWRSTSSLSTYEAAEEFAGTAVWLEFSGLDGLNVVDLSLSTSRIPRLRTITTHNDPAVGTSATSYFIPVPPGAVAGDVMVAELFIEPTGAVITSPTGWFEAPNSPVDLAASHSQRVFWKRLTTADTGLYTWTHADGAVTSTAALVARYDRCTSYGVPLETLTSAAKATQGTAGLTSPAVSGTTTGPDRKWLFLPMDYGAVKWSGHTSPFLEAADDAAGQALALKDQAVAGASGSITATASVSNKMTAWLGALIGEPTRPGQFFHTLG